MLPRAPAVLQQSEKNRKFYRYFEASRKVPTSLRWVNHPRKQSQHDGGSLQEGPSRPLCTGYSQGLPFTAPPHRPTQMRFQLEVRSTISPTPYFFRRIHFLAASLRALGGLTTNHEIVVSVGGGSGRENFYQSQPWSTLYPILWRSVPVKAFESIGYRATNRDRASHMSRADYVMLVDADVIFLRDFSELLSGLQQAPALCGVMAHVSPFTRPPVLRPRFSKRHPSDGSAGSYWQMLAENFGVAELPLECQYSGWGLMGDTAHQFAPAYFNGGMIIGPHEHIDKMCSEYLAAEMSVDEVMETFFLPQLARTLAIYKAGLPWRTLPLRYNFPNDPNFDAGHPDELANAAILHYLRTPIVHRDNDFTAPDNVRSLVSRTDLLGSNELLRRRIAELHEIVLGEERACRV